MNLLNPKNIILDAVKNKLVGTGIELITMVFNIIDNKYDILMTDDKGNNSKSPLTESEISLIKKMFISKITKKFKDESDKEIKDVIIQINFNQTNQDIKIGLYIQDVFGEITKIDF